MKFPMNYPNEPPEMRFLTPIWHPNGEATTCSSGVRVHASGAARFIAALLVVAAVPGTVHPPWLGAQQCQLLALPRCCPISRTVTMVAG